ncbi:MAG: sodium:solute symporter [Anaerolineaceae bacterium 4572_78]|nr:MAG: sodium:solute symporter [Anaerolineaceae bacterium 4572_78]
MIARIIVLSLYAIMIIAVGIFGFRKTKSFKDFFLAGGNVGALMSAFSYGTAYFSAVLFIGFAGKVGWGFGYSGLWIAVFNALVGVLGMWGIFGWRIKKMSIEYDVTTMSEFLEKRYDSPFLKLYASIVIFVFLIPYSAAVFIGLSYLFTSNFGIPYWYSLIFMGLFTAIYLVMGGYKSMAMIDMIFGMIMSVSVIVLYFSTVSVGGGLGAITISLAEIDSQLTQAVGPPGLWALFSLIFLTSIAPFAMPQLIQKFYAIKDKQAVQQGMVASTIFAILIGGVAYFTGATTRIFLNPTSTPAAFSDGKPIFDALMPELLTKVIPESLSILMLLLVMSASMSTLAALVLVSSSSLVKDFYAGFINKNVSDEQLTLLMRFASGLFVFLSVIIAYFKPQTIVTILGISWGAIGASFLGPFVWGLLSKKVTKWGAISSSVIGLIVTLGLYYFADHSSPSAGTIGMMVSLALNPIVSVFTHD